MNQIAIVKSVEKDGVAVIETSRKTMCDFCERGANCSHDCEITGLFSRGGTMTARAVNKINAKTGDVVEVDTPSSIVLLYAAVIFIAPIVIALLLYAVFIQVSQSAGYIASAAGFVLTFVAIYFIFEHGKKRKPDIEIIAVKIPNIDSRNKK